MSKCKKGKLDHSCLKDKSVMSCFILPTYSSLHLRFIRKQSTGQPSQLLTKRTCPLLVCLISKVGFAFYHTICSHTCALQKHMALQLNCSLDYFCTHNVYRRSIRLCPGLLPLRLCDNVLTAGWHSLNQAKSQDCAPHYSLRGGVRLCDDWRKPRRRRTKESYM